MTRVERFAADTGMFSEVRRLLVGCSGGADSIVLLEVLARLAPLHDLELAVAHLNHGIRGQPADGDEAHVRQAAEALGLPCRTRKVEVDVGAGRGAGGIETRARTARLAFFEEIAAEWSADGVALGHTADDQAETVILNLVRGAGLRGVGGMRPRGRVNRLRIVRPLLIVRRAELRRWASARGLAWREDETNADVSIARNRVRLRVVPELEKIHPGAVANLARAASLLQQEEELLDRLVEDAFSRLVVRDEFPGGLRIAKSALDNLPHGMQLRLLRRAVAEVRGELRGLARAHVDAAIDRVAFGPEGARDLPGVRVVDTGRDLRLLPLSGRHLRPTGAAADVATSAPLCEPVESIRGVGGDASTTNVEGNLSHPDP